MLIYFFRFYGSCIYSTLPKFPHHQSLFADHHHHHHEASKRAQSTTMADKENDTRHTHNIDDIEAAYILGLSDAGTLPSEIASKVARDKSTITRLLKRYNYKSFAGVNKRPGRPKKATERDIRAIVRKAIANRRSPLADITNFSPIDISESTTRRILKEAGLQKHIAVKKPFLTDKQMADRLQWALKHKDWTLKDWMRIIWSDESKIEIGKDSRVTWVSRRVDEKWKSECLIPSFKSQRTSIMVWGCFTGDKLGPLLIFHKGGINASDYIRILQDGLLPFVEKLNSVHAKPNDDNIRVATMGKYTFMQDNAPIHKAIATKGFFHDHCIAVMDWPANSPDLNPIEHLWPEIKARFHQEWLKMMEEIPSNRTEKLDLYASALKRLWKKGMWNLSLRLVESMPDRVAAVIAAKGGHIRY